MKKEKFEVLGNNYNGILFNTDRNQNIYIPELIKWLQEYQKEFGEDIYLSRSEEISDHGTTGFVPTRKVIKEIEMGYASIRSLLQSHNADYFISKYNLNEWYIAEGGDPTDMFRVSIQDIKEML